jgi:hypothetical protein
VGAFLRQAEDILDTAYHGDVDQNLVIVIDRRGGISVLDPTGWTLPALSAEYAAQAVYRVERRGDAVRVEGLSGSERCLLQRGENRERLWGIGMPGIPVACARPAHAKMLQTSALVLG